MRKIQAQKRSVRTVRVPIYSSRAHVPFLVEAQVRSVHVPIYVARARITGSKRGSVR